MKYHSKNEAIAFDAILKELGHLKSQIETLEGKKSEKSDAR